MPWITGLLFSGIWRATEQQVGSLATPIQDLPDNCGGIEDGAVDAHTFHRQAVGGVDLYYAAGAAADGAGHELLERYLAWQVMACRKVGDGLQHRGRATSEDLDV